MTHQAEAVSAPEPRRPWPATYGPRHGPFARRIATAAKASYRYVGSRSERRRRSSLLPYGHGWPWPLSRFCVPNVQPSRLMRPRIATSTTMHRPDGDTGFVTWLDVVIHGDPANEDALADLIGRMRAAIIHVGMAGSDLFTALDADSGELEALYEVFFDEVTSNRRR